MNLVSLWILFENVLFWYLVPIVQCMSELIHAYFYMTLHGIPWLASRHNCCMILNQSICKELATCNAARQITLCAINHVYQCSTSLQFSHSTWLSVFISQNRVHNNKCMEQINDVFRRKKGKKVVILHMSRGASAFFIYQYASSQYIACKTV